MRTISFVSTLALAAVFLTAGIAPSPAQSQTGGTICVCGEVAAFTAATDTDAGSLEIGGETFAIAAGTTIANSDLIMPGVTLCFSARRDAGGAAIGPAAVSAAGASDAPTLGIPTSVTVPQGGSLTFAPTALDPAGGAAAVEVCGLPAGATFDEQTGLFTFTPSSTQLNQTFPITFTATTCGGGSVTRTLDVSVGAAGQAAPFFVSGGGPFVATGGAATTFNFSAGSAVANCDVQVTASGLPANATFDEATGDLTFTPGDDQLGRTFAVTLTATDCQNRTTTLTVPLVAAAEGGAGALCVPVRKVTFTPTPIGSVCGSVTITIFNAGGGALEISSASLQSGTDFRIEGASATGTSVGPGGQAEIVITFVPTRNGNRTDTLTISAGGQTATVRLSGRGTR